MACVATAVCRYFAAVGHPTLEASEWRAIAAALLEVDQTYLAGRALAHAAMLDAVEAVLKLSEVCETQIMECANV